MKRILMAAAALALLLTGSHSTRAQDAASQIIGIWKVVDISRKDVASGKIEKPYGEKPGGYYIYTRGGHFSWTFVADNRQNLQGPPRQMQSASSYSDTKLRHRNLQS
jgi:hypothetical protein